MANEFTTRNLPYFSDFEIVNSCVHNPLPIEEDGEDE